MVDVLTVMLTAIFTGLGVSIGNIIFELYFKGHFIQWKKNRKVRVEKMKRLLNYKRPWLAAVLNFFIWGAGYIYAGRKRTVGVILLIIQIFVSSGFELQQIAAQSTFEAVTYFFLLVIISSYLAHDAFYEAKKRNEDPQAPTKVAAKK